MAIYRVYTRANPSRGCLVAKGKHIQTSSSASCASPTKIHSGRLQTLSTIPPQDPKISIKSFCFCDEDRQFPSGSLAFSKHSPLAGKPSGLPTDQAVFGGRSGLRMAVLIMSDLCPVTGEVATRSPLAEVVEKSVGGSESWDQRVFSIGDWTSMDCRAQKKRSSHGHITRIHATMNP